MNTRPNSEGLHTSSAPSRLIARLSRWFHRGIFLGACEGEPLVLTCSLRRVDPRFAETGRPVDRSLAANACDVPLSGDPRRGARSGFPIRGGKGENMDTESRTKEAKSRTKEPNVTRRKLLKTGAAGVLGTAAATTIMATPASAADGDPVILGQNNTSFLATGITNPDTLDGLSFGGGFLQSVRSFGGPAISASTLGGPAMSADAEGTGVIGFGQLGAGISGLSGDGIGVHGRSDHGTGIKAEAGPHVQSEGTAFEAVGPVKFSTSGLAAVGASTDRVTVNPGVPISPQSKVLAMLQGNSGSKAMVEHIEVDPAADTFEIFLTKPSIRAVQVSWFLIS
jgi:hypothetical protein